MSEPNWQDWQPEQTTQADPPEQARWKNSIGKCAWGSAGIVTAATVIWTLVRMSTWTKSVGIDSAFTIGTYGLAVFIIISACALAHIVNQIFRR
jgi:hypothetical protein